MLKYAFCFIVIFVRPLPQIKGSDYSIADFFRWRKREFRVLSAVCERFCQQFVKDFHKLLTTLENFVFCQQFVKIADKT